MGVLTNHHEWRDQLDNREINNRCVSTFIISLQKECIYISPHAITILGNRRNMYSIANNRTDEKCNIVNWMKVKIRKSRNLVQGTLPYNTTDTKISLVEL